MAPGVPYRWGAYCAYCALLSAVQTVSAYFTKQASAVIVIGVVLCAVPAAVGLLKRRRFGVWMLIALAALAARMIGMAMSASARHRAILIIATVSYFRKRWQWLA